MPNDASPTLTIAILSSQCLVWLGLQKILESSATVPMIVHPHQGRAPDRLLAHCRPDLFILDLETERDALSTIKQIREAAPSSKIVLLCGFGDKDRTREAFASGVDGIILNVQPSAAVLAMIEALLTDEKSPAPLKRNGAECIGFATSFTKRGESDLQSPAWPDVLTEREREIICLVKQGLSNKDIAHQLSISDSTVRHHMSNIFDKVGVSNRQKLLIHAHHVHSSPV
jgi:DNA-binding NarL/FixJ family response regulator